MWIARDKAGTCLISEEKPERMTCHWRSPNHRYYVMNEKYSLELFPELKWTDEPKEIEFGLVF